MIQTYFGNGKGKTTAAIGAAIRCMGCGRKVLFVEFLKNNDSAEFAVMDSFENMDVLFSKEHYRLYDNKKEDLTAKFSAAYTKLLLEETVSVLPSYQMVVLDEVLDAVTFGYIDEQVLVGLLQKWQNRVEIILTGHTLPEAIRQVSDYISEVKAVSHPYDSGTPSRKGIEF